MVMERMLANDQDRAGTKSYFNVLAPAPEGFRSPEGYTFCCFYVDSNVKAPSRLAPPRAKKGVQGAGGIVSMEGPLLEGRAGGQRTSMLGRCLQKC